MQWLPLVIFLSPQPQSYSPTRFCWYLLVNGHLWSANKLDSEEETMPNKPKNRLGRFLKSKRFLVFALLVFPPLALLNGCAYTYNSNTSVSGDGGSVNTGVSSSSSRSANISIGGKTQIKYWWHWYQSRTLIRCRTDTTNSQSAGLSMSYMWRCGVYGAQERI